MFEEQSYLNELYSLVFYQGCRSLQRNRFNNEKNNSLKRCLLRSVNSKNTKNLTFDFTLQNGTSTFDL